MKTDNGAAPARSRREPPSFRKLVVRRCERLGPWMVQVTMGGPELRGFEVGEPAASVRLLLPSPGERELVMPVWDRNEFLLSDGRRPVIRTFTPRRVDRDGLELDLDIVLHEGGVASGWALTVTPGDVVAVSGPGRGYTIVPGATGFLLAGDETAIPAISQLLEFIAQETAVEIHIEVTHPDARLPLPDHFGASVHWHDTPVAAPPGDRLVAAMETADIDPGTRIWVAGEAASVQRIRNHLFRERGIPRAQATVRGYWKRADRRD